MQVTEQEREIVRLWIESSAVYAGTYAALGTGMVDGYSARVKKGPVKIPGTCVVCHEEDQLRQKNPSRLGGGKPTPEYESLLSQIESHKYQLETKKRFDMPGFRPNEHYVREMKRYGILPASHAVSDPINVYDVDQKYWRSFWYEAH
ncbi:MAG: hypothetical protein ISS35_10085 [Kiritimatiellae bacterium]|nr:hypothetical protein [Kiritimatiellia bacterium]